MEGAAGESLVEDYWWNNYESLLPQDSLQQQLAKDQNGGEGGLRRVLQSSVKNEWKELLINASWKVVHLS